MEGGDSARKRNRSLFNRLKKRYNEIKGVRVGDYVISPNGRISRVTYIWRDEKGKPLVYQAGGDKYGQFHLGDGYISYSGSLTGGFKGDTKFKNTGRKKIGYVWIWDQGLMGFDRGVSYPMKFRVFKASKNEKD